MTSQADEEFVNYCSGLKGEVAGPQRSECLERAPETGLCVG